MIPNLGIGAATVEMYWIRISKWDFKKLFGNNL